MPLCNMEDVEEDEDDKMLCEQGGVVVCHG